MYKLNVRILGTLVRLSLTIIQMWHPIGAHGPPLFSLMISIIPSRVVYSLTQSHKSLSSLLRSLSFTLFSNQLLYKYIEMEIELHMEECCFVKRIATSKRWRCFRWFNHMTKSVIRSLFQRENLRSLNFEEQRWAICVSMLVGALLSPL